MGCDNYRYQHSANHRMNRSRVRPGYPCRSPLNSKDSSIKPVLVAFQLILACLSAGCDRISQTAAPVATQTTVRKDFGERQLDQMLDDRPDMRDEVARSHTVVAWLIDGFNGDRLGQRVYWNANSPRSGRPAEHGPSYGSYPPYIAISGGTETTAVDKWAAVIYEMHNLENSEDFKRISEAAIKGTFDADAFADECVKMEFAALLKTRDFLAANPLPKSKHGKDVLYNWVTSDLGSYDDYKKRFDVPGTNGFNSNFKYFKEYYETIIAPYAETMRRTNQ